MNRKICRPVAGMADTEKESYDQALSQWEEIEMTQSSRGTALQPINESAVSKDFWQFWKFCSADADLRDERVRNRNYDVKKDQ